MAKREFWNEVLKITLIVLFMIMMGFIVPTIIGFVFGAYESVVGGKPLDINDYFVKNMFYFLFVIFAIVGYLIFAIRELVIYGDEDPITSDKRRLFSTVVDHNPEEDGALFRLLKPLVPKFTKWAKNPIRIFLFSLIVFSILGLFSATTGSFFSGIPQTQFQVTPTSETILASEPASTGENGVFVFIIMSILLGFLQYGLKKIIPDNKTLRVIVFFTLALLIITPIVGVSWMGYHSLRYGNDEAKLFATFVFGTMGAFITVLFGSFIPFYVWHFTNNSFLKISTLISSNEQIAIWTIILISVILFLWVSTEVVIMKVKKKFKKPQSVYAEKL